MVLNTLIEEGLIVTLEKVSLKIFQLPALRKTFQAAYTTGKQFGVPFEEFFPTTAFSKRPSPSHFTDSMFNFASNHLNN